MLSVASTRTGPGSSAIITAPGEICGLGAGRAARAPRRAGLRHSAEGSQVMRCARRRWTCMPASAPRTRRHGFFRAVFRDSSCVVGPSASTRLRRVRHGCPGASRMVVQPSGEVGGARPSAPDLALGARHRTLPVGAAGVSRPGISTGALVSVRPRPWPSASKRSRSNSASVRWHCSKSKRAKLLPVGLMPRCQPCPVPPSDGRHAPGMPASSGRQPAWTARARSR